LSEQDRASRGLRIIHVFAVAIIVRLIVLAFLPDQGFPDAQAYILMGKQLLSGELTTENYYMPLYPIFVAITGGGGHITQLAEILISALTVALIYRLTLDVFGDLRAALLSAIASAFYPHFLFYSVSGLTETLFLGLFVGSFISFYRQRYWLGSLLLVASILVRPTVDLIAPLLIVAFALVVHRQGWRQIGAHLLKYGLVYVVLMAPWWAHNFEKYGHFVRLSLGAGVVLYSGNNPLNTTGGGVMYAPNEPGYEEHENDLSFGPVSHLPDVYERDVELKRLAVEFIVNHPKRFVELAGIKFMRFWRLWPFNAGYQQPEIIAASLLSYGVALALSILFLWKNAKRYWRKLSPVLLFTAYLTAVHMVTIGSIRYRLPVEPFLIIFAASMLSELATRWRPLDRLLTSFWLPRDTAPYELKKKTGNG